MVFPSNSLPWTDLIPRWLEQRSLRHVGITREKWGALEQVPRMGDKVCPVKSNPSPHPWEDTEPPFPEVQPGAAQLEGCSDAAAAGAVAGHCAALSAGRAEGM